MDGGAITGVDVSGLDYSMLTHGDLVNIVLQRSDVINDEKRPGDVIREWEAGQPERLNKIVEEKGVVLAQRAARIIQTEFEAMLPELDAMAPSRVADIGCGYGFFDLFVHDRYGAELLLIDIEGNDRRHFGFEEEGAAYTSLWTAERFLQANGVSLDKVDSWNPEVDDAPQTDKIDLAVSFLACGYHFPVDMYLPFFRYGVRKGGHIVLDVRAQYFQDCKRILSQYGKVRLFSQGRGKKRVILQKGHAK